jgi:ankyrin repeat protein
MKNACIIKNCYHVQDHVLTFYQMVFNISLFLDYLRTRDDPQMSSETIDQLEEFLKTINIDLYETDCDGHGHSLLDLMCTKNEYLYPQVLDYLIKVCGMDQNHLSNNGNHILGLACGHIDSVEMIKHLIKKYDMNVNHLNYHGISILGIACVNNSVEVIEYLIKECSMDQNHLDNNGNSILGIACANNDSVNVIEYLIKECSMDQNHLDNNGNSILGLACMNNSVNVIEYLIKECLMDLNHFNSDGHRILSISCAHNKLVNVIKFLIEECGLNPNYLDNNGHSALSFACTNNDSNVIEYLIKVCSMDTNYWDIDGNSILGLAADNNSVEVIRFLIEECGIDMNHLDNQNNSILGIACAKNNFVDVIHYLIKECRMDPNHVNQFGATILYLACVYNESVEVIKYLMEITEVEIHIMFTDKCKRLIALEWEDQIKFNQLIMQSIDKHGTDLVIEIIEQINILTLEPSVRKKLSLPDPFESRFDKFKQLVDELEMCVQIQDPGPDQLNSESLNSENSESLNSENSESLNSESLDRSSHLSDNKDQTQGIIFIHNQIPYYGNLRTALSALELTRGVEEILCQDLEPIVLTSELSHDLMDQWVRSIDKRMDIMAIRSEDLISLLNHINKYPTTGTNLTSIEYQVIRYVDSISISISISIGSSDGQILSDLKEFAQSHGMKLLYLHLHNIELRSID